MNAVYESSAIGEIVNVFGFISGWDDKLSEMSDFSGGTDDEEDDQDYDDKNEGKELELRLQLVSHTALCKTSSPNLDEDISEV